MVNSIKGGFNQLVFLGLMVRTAGFPVDRSINQPSDDIVLNSSLEVTLSE